MIAQYAMHGSGYGLWSLSLRVLFLLAAACLIPACKKSGSSTPVPPPNVAPTATVNAPAGVASGVILVSYVLADPESDPCSIVVHYSTNSGGTWSSAAQGVGGDGTAALTASPAGTAHTFAWDSKADGVAPAAPVTTVRVRIFPSDDDPGTPGQSSDFTVNNDTPPTVAFAPPGSPVSGLILFNYSIRDTLSEITMVVPEFSIDGGTTWAPATRGPGGEGAADLSSSPAGTVHAFVWNSVRDGVASVGAVNTVRFRLTPSDDQAGVPVATPVFEVDNSTHAPGGRVPGFPLQLDFAPKADWARAVATDGAHLYVFGFSGFDPTDTPGPSVGWKVVKRGSRTGDADASFGTGGTLSIDPGPGFHLPSRILIDGAFLFLIGLQESAAASRDFSLRIEKRDAATGALDPDFGTAGVVTEPGAARADGIPLPWAALVDGSGLLLAGAETVSGENLARRLERRDPVTGALLPGWPLTDDLNGDVDAFFGLTTSAGSMWLAGCQDVAPGSATTGKMLLEKRGAADGSSDPGFDGDGALETDATAGDDSAEDVVEAGGFLYVYSRTETAPGAGAYEGRIDRIDSATGAISTTVSAPFGTDPTGLLPSRHLAIEGTDLYVTASAGLTDAGWRIQKRAAATLLPDGTFGTVTVDFGGDDRPQDLLLFGGVLFVVGTDSEAGGGQWRVEAFWR